jgi:hypothetical protein
MMTYMNTMLAQNLIIMGRGWSVTAISVGSVVVTALLILVLVPLGRHLMGEGGECAGAAASVIGSEACVLVAMLTRFRRFPLDARNIRVFTKSIVLGIAVLVIDRQMRGLGAARLAVDAVLYCVAAVAIGIVRFEDIATVVRLLRMKGRQMPAPATGAGE